MTDIDLTKDILSIRKDVAFTKDALAFVHQLTLYLFDKLIKTSILVDDTTYKKTLQAKTAQTSVRIEMSDDLAKECVAEGTKWVTMYYSSDQEKKPKLWTNQVEAVIRNIVGSYQSERKVSKSFLVYIIAVVQHILHKIFRDASGTLNVTDLRNVVRNDLSLDILFYPMIIRGIS